jgi:hypothetical protein
MTSGASMLRLSMESTPKTTCKYVQDSMYIAKGKYGKYAKEDASVKEGHNKPLSKEGDNKPLAKDGNWAGYNNKPLATRAIGCICHAR